MAKKQDFVKAFANDRAGNVDINDPMNNLITKPEATKPQKEPKKKAAAPDAAKGVRLAGFTPTAKHDGKRTKRVQLVMAPELYERTKTAAERAGVSFNEFVNQLCNEVTQ